MPTSHNNTKFTLSLFAFAGGQTCIGSTPFQKPSRAHPHKLLIPQHTSWALSALQKDLVLEELLAARAYPMSVAQIFGVTTQTS